MCFCRIKNIKGSSNNEPPKGVGSWIEAWENYMGFKAIYCVCKDCQKLATDGAHVKKVGTDDDSWYIVPLCHEHNMNTDVIEVDGDMLMPANKSELGDGFNNLV